MQTRLGRWIALTASTLIAVGAGLWCLRQWRLRDPASTVEFRQRPDSAATAEMPHTTVEEFFRVDRSALIPTLPEQRSFFVSLAACEALFGPDLSHMRYDPWTYLWDVGGRDEEYVWPEHGLGRWRLTTNRDGLRETGDPLARDCSVRVLTTGDSHAFGVCDTDETSASRLEQLLTAELAPRSVEVLNAAQPGYDAFNYLGVLQRFQAFEPQAFAVLFFGGNDLLSVLEMYYRFTREPAPPPPTDEKRRRAEMLGHAPNALGQCYDGGAYLLAHPEQGELAVRVNARLFAEMQAFCEARGVRLLVVYLPPPCDLAWPEPHEEIEAGRRLCGLPPGAGSGLAQVESRFMATLGELSIEVLDMRASFAASQQPPYWRKDLHLSVEGHRLVAEALRPRIAALLSGR